MRIKMLVLEATTLVTLLLFVCGCAEKTNREVQNAPQSEVNREEVAQAKFDELNQQLAIDIKNLEQKLDEADSQAEKQQLFGEMNPAPGFIEGMLKLASEYAETKIAVPAALAALGRLKGAERDPAMTLLIEKFPSRVDFKKMSKSLLEEIPSPGAERWMRKMIVNAANETVKSAVTLNLAEFVNRLGLYQVIFDDNPELRKRLSPQHRDYIYAERTPESYNELAAMLKRACENQDEAFRRKANALSVELTQLRIGQVAPDIEGNDLDGISFKLSDYRGKVVMLDFWGHWCQPCRQMYPHEQFLAEALKDEPFVLLGVNSDGDIETARDAVREEGLPWRHFWNGPEGMFGGIADAWNVEGWPTVYLIDHEGVIRAKHIAYENLDRAIESVFAEMGSKVTLNFEHTN